jgi:fibronectin type 3 domain-containing protein
LAVAAAAAATLHPASRDAPGRTSRDDRVAGNNQVSLSWGAVAGATSYNIYRSTTAGQQGSSVGTSTSTSFVDTGAINGTSYFYQVTAVNAGGEGQPSSQSSACPRLLR